MEGLALMALLASAPIVALATQSWVGRLADRSPSKNVVLAGLITGSAVSILLLPGSPAFLWQLGISALFAAFFISIQPLGDAIMLESLQRQRFSFGPIRLLGSYAFAAANVAAGIFLQNRGMATPYAIAFFLALTLAAWRLLPNTPGYQRSKAVVPLRRLLQLPAIKPLLALVMALQLAMGYFYSYFTLHFSALPGATSTLVGVAYAISAVSETPFLLLSERLFKRFGAGKLMVVSAGLLTLRFLLLGTTNSVPAALASQALHGGGFVVITYTMARYINLVTPDELKAGGQLLLSTVAYGLARVFGIFAGGLIRQAVGSAGGFIAMAVLCAVTFVAAGRYFLPRPAFNGFGGIPPAGN